MAKKITESQQKLKSILSELMEEGKAYEYDFLYKSAYFKSFHGSFNALLSKGHISHSDQGQNSFTLNR